MCTLFVFTMICGVWQYAAIENTFYFEDRENIVSEEICEYAVTQRIAEHKRLNYNTNTSGIEPLLLAWFSSLRPRRQENPSLPPAK